MGLYLEEQEKSDRLPAAAAPDTWFRRPPGQERNNKTDMNDATKPSMLSRLINVPERLSASAALAFLVRPEGLGVFSERALVVAGDSSPEDGVGRVEPEGHAAIFDLPAVALRSVGSAAKGDDAGTTATRMANLLE